MSLAKPVMRGMLAKRLRIHLPLAFLSSFGLAMAIKFMITEPRKQAYADFYKNYDSAKEFEAMREAGIFESVQPSGK
ncbi:cytochrome c oxidase subunit 6C [Parambassis ranga]|uniref:Cytochrome c oxidase subunit 6C n=1 Tax=Parambassis ranga TaxID=210632 RepID=A0A6P7K9B5_9TELE|nr:cytochrome c oxidase subunit 6C-1 [Parambassis ranga]XP_028285103.1 cytochrome c oxidase subunit 6C-1 [Parambassis ranga]